MEHRGLQHPSEGVRLLGFALLPAEQLLEGFVEVRVQLAAEPTQIGAAGLEDPFAVWIVREGVQEVLERQVRMTTGDGFAERDVEDGFDRGGEHPYRLLQASSIVARSG